MENSVNSGADSQKLEHFFVVFWGSRELLFSRSFFTGRRKIAKIYLNQFTDNTIRSKGNTEGLLPAPEPSAGGRICWLGGPWQKTNSFLSAS